MKVSSTQGEQLAVLGAGECFGETAILTGEPRNATVTRVRCAEWDAPMATCRREHFAPFPWRDACLPPHR
eukprot:6204509-Prymnesium_polylepis.1